MITYKKIIEDFKELVKNHKQINSFGTGDIQQLIYLTSQVDGKDNTKNEAPIYPLLFVVPNPVNRGEQQITYSFSVVIGDIMNTKNYDIETQLLSDTLQMAEDVLAQFKYSVTQAQGDFEDKYDIQLPVTITNFSEAYDDILVGWTLGIDIVVDNPLNRCLSPFKNFD